MSDRVSDKGHTADETPDFQVVDGYWMPPVSDDRRSINHLPHVSLWRLFRERYLFFHRNRVGGFSGTIGPFSYDGILDCDGSADEEVLWHELHIFNWRVIKWTFTQ